MFGICWGNLTHAISLDKASNCTTVEFTLLLAGIRIASFGTREMTCIAKRKP